MAASYVYKDIEFFAENGVVYITDLKKAEKVTSWENLPPEEMVRVRKGLPPKEFIKRAIAVASVESGRYDGYKSELKKIRDFLNNAKEVYDRAIQQGAIDDKKVSEEKLKARSKPPIMLVTNIPWRTKTARQILLEGLD